MFIRQIAVLLGLGIMLLLLGFYFVSVTSPFDNAKLQEYIEKNEIAQTDDENLNNIISELIQENKSIYYFSNNAFIAFIIFTLVITCFAAVGHLFIDKLFFREFYETASIYIALRRGLLIALSFFAAIYLSLSGSPTLEIIFSVAIIIAIELLFTIFLQEPLSKLFVTHHKKIAETPSALDSAVS
ncbi:hypothetical protein KC678_05535 [Candidatus Dojkabacteria bacterium]|uniref:Uncharacterized protein n=1 Tax=Candidatus Dojkabacteria bacterium TaxID=2099670 RepID=A0A955RH95_9BACT|nr:hypothetical protein [Candidatus Dojkabacteria bacterium]